MLVFHTYWSGGGDISQEAVLAKIAGDAGLDCGVFHPRAVAPFPDRPRFGLLGVY
jgi:predicted DsbA family dithiol-disulfide isomerase